MGQLNKAEVVVSRGSYLPPGFVAGLMRDGMSSFGVILLLYFLNRCDFKLMADKDGFYFDIICESVIFDRGYRRLACVDLCVSESKVSRGISELIKFGYLKRSSGELKLELKSVFRNYIRRKHTL
jgi:hypothetical protein